MTQTAIGQPRYVGQRKDDLAYLLIDLTEILRGAYKLIVTVKDKRMGGAAGRETLFRLVA